MKVGVKYTVFSIREDPKTKTTVWTKAGVAFLNPDDSINIYLDVLPLDGKLHIREIGKEEQVR